MSKFNRAFQVFTENGGIQADRKQMIKSIAHVLNVSEANAGVYLYKCIKRGNTEGTAVPASKTEVKEKRIKHRPVAKEDIPGDREALRHPNINDGDYSCVPEFLKKCYHQRGYRI